MSFKKLLRKGVEVYFAVEAMGSLWFPEVWWSGRCRLMAASPQGRLLGAGGCFRLPGWKYLLPPGVSSHGLSLKLLWVGFRVVGGLFFQDICDL